VAEPEKGTHKEAEGLIGFKVILPEVVTEGTWGILQ
jgi:hypothetical protein